MSDSYSNPLNPVISITQYPVGTADYLNVVHGSQFYTDLEMIKINLENLKYKSRNLISSTILYDQAPITFNVTSLEEDIDYLIKGLENTIEKYKIIEK